MTNVGKAVVGCCAALFLLGVAGCAPKINRFDVLPFQVCEGTPPTVTWQISGSPELATTPAIQPLAGQPLRYQAIEDTVFTLHAKRWPHHPKVSETDVRVHQTHAPAREPIAFQMKCEGGNLVGILPRPPEERDPKIRLETVVSDGSREVTVEHEGRSVTLTASAPSTNAFQGATMAGTWKVTTALRANERCGAPAAAPPGKDHPDRSLRVREADMAIDIKNLVETIVIVMLKNRSFDHMLGYLSLKDGTNRTDIEGIADPASSSYVNDSAGETYSLFATKDGGFPGDLPHDRYEVDVQLAKSDATGKHEMTGFVESYRQSMKVRKVPKKASPMRFMKDGNQVPTMDFFAQNFAVCDHWFAPLPADTPISSGFERNDDHPPLPVGPGQRFPARDLRSPHRKPGALG